MSDPYGEVVWTDTWYGRGHPIPTEEAVERVKDAFSEVGPGCYAVQDEDFGFCLIDIDRTGEKINSERAAIRSWWENYWSYSMDVFNEDELEYIENVLKLKIPSDR